MTKEILLKKLEDLKAQGKEPHGLLRDLLIEMKLDEEEE